MTNKKISSNFAAWLYTISTNGLNLALGLLTGVILARSLGPEGRGQLAAILLIPNLIAPIGLIGLNDAIVYSLGQKKIKTKELFDNSIFLVIVLSLIVVGVGLVLMPFLISEKLIKHLSLTNSYLIVLIPAYYLSLTLLAFAQGNLHFKKYNFFQILPTTFYFLALLTLWVTNNLVVQYAVWASVFGVVVSALSLWFLSPQKTKLNFTWRTSKYLIKRGSTFHISTVISLVSNQLDKIIIIAFMSDTMVGYYVVAFTFASAGLSSVAHATHTVMFPIIARENDLTKKKAFFYKGLLLSSLFLLFVSIAFILIAEWLLPLLFGNQYTESIPLASILIIAYLPLSLRTIIIRNLKGLGASRHATISELISLVTFLIISIPMLNTYSLYGIGYSLIIANILSLAYLFWGLNKLFLDKNNRNSLIP